MPSQAGSKSSRNKVQAHRKRLRRLGMRPIQIWVADVRSPAFAAEAHRQSLAVANSPHARRDQDFINAITGWAGTWSGSSDGTKIPGYPVLLCVLCVQAFDVPASFAVIDIAVHSGQEEIHSLLVTSDLAPHLNFVS